MKRKLTTLLFALISIFTYAQIQDTFFGITLGKTRMRTAIRRLSYKYKLTINEENDDLGNIEFYDAKLGGVTWDYVTMAFYDSKFSSAYVYSHFENREQASKYYNTILNKLKNKYDSDSTIISFEGPHKQDGLIDYQYYEDKSNTNVCYISLDHSESKDGRMLYYVNLSYWNAPLKQKRTESEIDEF